MKLYAFWKYDTPPYLLGGEVREIFDDGYVGIIGHEYYKFKPVKIVPMEAGLELKKRLDEAYDRYDAARIKALNDLKETVKEIAG